MSLIIKFWIQFEKKFSNQYIDILEQKQKKLQTPYQREDVHCKTMDQIFDPLSVSIIFHEAWSNNEPHFSKLSTFCRRFASVYPSNMRVKSDFSVVS